MPSRYDKRGFWVALSNGVKNFQVRAIRVLGLIKNISWKTYLEKGFYWGKALLGGIALGLTFIWGMVTHWKEKSLHRISSAPKNYGKDVEDKENDQPDIPPPEMPPPPEAVLSLKVEEILGDRLQSLMQGFNQKCKDVENDFFSLGEELQVLCSETDFLARTAQEAVQDDQGQDPAAKLAEIVNNAQSLLTFLGQDHMTIETNLECIESVVQRLKNLIDQSITIKKLGKALRMIGLNISIESTRNLESHDIFNDLAQQIRKLSDTVTDAASKIRDDAEAAQGNLSGLHLNMNESLYQLKELSASAEKSMAQALPEVEKIIALSTEVLTQTHDQSERISHQVGQIVMDIQLHDSVSQRIEHVGLALLEVNDGLLAVCRSADDHSAEVKLVDAYAIITLQVAQVGRVIHEIRDIFKSTFRAFDQIRDVVKKLLVSLNSLHSDTDASGMATGREDNHIESLKSILFYLNDLIKQGDQEMARANRATDDSRQTAERLSQHAKDIRDLNFDIHLKALNAIASSLRLGSKGKTIEVLVQDMKALAIQSNDDVALFESAIKEIISQSGSMQTKSRTSDTGDAVGDVDMERLLTDFSYVCSQFESAISKALKLGATLEQRIETVRSALLFLEGFADQIEVSLSELKSLGSELKPYVNETLAVNEDIHARLSQRYTTHQERVIHNEMFNNAIELESSSAASQDIFDDQNIDFFVEDGSNDSKEDSSEKDSETDLGDNVELF